MICIFDLTKCSAVSVCFYVETTTRIQFCPFQVHQPFVTDPVGNRKLSLRFDCSQFKPEEINVKTCDNVVCVHAKHAEETPGKKKVVEFNKNYVLPDNVDPMKVKSILSRDGVLHLEAPAPPSVKAPREYLIPIDHM